MRNPETTKNNILKQSGILFNTQGYKSTSISNITDATGYTKGAIYRHFDSKEALEKETLIYLSGIMFDKMRELIKNQQTAGNKIREVLNFFESYIINAPIKGGCPLLNVAIEADDANPLLKEEAAKILNSLKGSLVHILNNGIKYNQIKADIDKNFYATIIIASLEGAIMMSKLRGQNDEMKIIIRHIENQLREIEI
ncbi:MAG: TetR/AcrR family transcriptional regulator [Bacteroidota bacterium]|nr:TetR/AcrR family transcriptional regulator [Bacteroidota bacterium]